VRALEKVKQRFKEASRDAVEGLGWQKIFEQYDDDQSGELEFDEFCFAVRQECGLSPDAVPVCRPWPPLQKLLSVFFFDWDVPVQLRFLAVKVRSAMDYRARTARSGSSSE
jgi:hypothetical protein